MKLRKIFRSGVKFLLSQEFRFNIMTRLGLYNKLDDETFLKKKFKVFMNKELDLSNPTTFNEKLNWLKLYDRDPEYTIMSDKYKVREYISDKLGEEYLIPLIGVWDSPDDINFDSLPDQFVLKCNHNSGLGMFICKDKKKLDIEKVKLGLRRGLKQDYYLPGREWSYKNIPRKVIAEKYMTNSYNSDEFTDYKFFCFNGYVDSVMVCLDRSSGDTKFYFFDKDWNLKRYNKKGQEAPHDFSIKKPKCMDKMFVIASELSKGIPFVRIDLYQSNNQIFFGEMTFYPDSGFDNNILPESDLYFGKLIDLKLANTNLKNMRRLL